MPQEIVDQHNPILQKRAQEVPVDAIASPKIKAVIARMKKALGKEPLGVAIAAPQIGELLRIFVVSGKVFKKDKDGKGKTLPPPRVERASRSDRTYINPEIIKTSRRKKIMHEGCLSVRSEKPGMLVWGSVPRAEKIKIRAYDERGKRAEHNVSNFFSQIFQHEIDHLEGVLYTEKAETTYEEKIPVGE